MGSLEIRNLTKRFGARAVLDGISLSVEEGEFFVLLGPSGGGKSTILRILCGIETADAGEISLAGRAITNLPPRARNIGMVFQDYGLYPHMTAFENIAYGLEARGLPRAQIQARVTEAAEKLGLTPLLERVIVDLSGGEQQRVALGRALAKDADLYLFDEPISNLDPKLRARARRDIQMVHRAKGKPTIYVTHDQTEALAIADRIAIIANGRLQQVGTADDLLRRPANLFVAGFLGSPAMNLLRGELIFDAGQSAYRVSLSLALSLPLPAAWTPALQAYGKSAVILGMPPAAIFPDAVIAAEPEAQVQAVPAELADFEPLVSEVIAQLTLPGGLSVAAVFQNVDETTLQAGSALTLYLDVSQVSLFDPDTETNLPLPHRAGL